MRAIGVKPGDVVWVRTYKADGQLHRWWQAQVEVVDDECLVVYSAQRPAPTEVYPCPAARDAGPSTAHRGRRARQALT